MLKAPTYSLALVCASRGFQGMVAILSTFPARTRTSATAFRSRRLRAFRAEGRRECKTLGAQQPGDESRLRGRARLGKDSL